MLEASGARKSLMFSLFGGCERRWPCAVMPLAAFLLLCLSSFGSLAASSDEPTAVEGSNKNAYVVVLPEGMDPAERDAILKNILSGQPAEPTAPEEESGLFANIDTVLQSLRDEVTLALMNAGRAKEVPLDLLDVLGASAGTDTPGLFALVVFAVIFGGALAVEFCLRHFIWKAAPKNVETEDTSFTDRMRLSLRWLFREIVMLFVFGGAATLLFHFIFRLEEPGRLIVTGIIVTATVVRIILAVAAFILAPKDAGRRLILFDDGDARSSYYALVLMLTLTAVILRPATLTDKLGGVDFEARLAYGVIFGSIVLSLALYVIWRLRFPVCKAVLAAAPDPEKPSALRRWIANTWHLWCTLAFIGIYFTTIHIRASTKGGSIAGAALGTMGLILLTPFIIRSLRLLLSEYYDRRMKAQDLTPSALRNSLELALERMVPIIVFVGAVIIGGMLWGVSIFNLGSLGIGAKIYEAVIDIGFILVIAYFLWELARGAIDQRLSEEHPKGDDDAAMGEEGHTPASRISTLLPLFRTTLMTIMVLVVIFVILSEMGVNVGPLIAGAGVIGIALGFGAQTLVTDIISGVFFLIDDAFRRGEYIDVGVAKGTVEKISLRSLQLRHHNGPVNTVPFGQIATVNNFSRDWAIIKLEIRLPFETDVNMVRKLVKKIGQEMMEDPTVSHMMLEPLKSQGVVRVDDSALVMRCKFTALPGQQFMVRREAFTRIQKRFAEEGLHFAPRRVIVDAPTPELSKAATAALDADPAEAGGGDGR